MFFLREDLNLENISIRNLIFFFLKEKYYRPVWKAKLKEQWINKLNSFFFLNIFSLLFQATGLLGIIIFLIIILPSFFFKKRWGIEIIFFVLYIFVLISFYESLLYNWQKTLLIMVSVFILRDIFFFFFQSCFWILSKLLTFIPFLDRNWDQPFVNYSCFLLETIVVVGTPLYYFYQQYLGYLELGKLFIYNFELTFFSYCFLYFRIKNLESVVNSILI